jgi:succinoglycan biosynthesis transport protein ExoP
MEISIYVGVLWRRKWVILLTTLVTVAVAIIGNSFLSPVYAATTTLRIQTSSSGLGVWEQYNVSHSDRLMRTYTLIALSDPLMTALMARLDLGSPPAVEPEVISGTELMAITAESEDPDLAADIANTLAELLVEQSSELYAGGAPSAAEILLERLQELEQEIQDAEAEYQTLSEELAFGSAQLIDLNQRIEMKEGIYTTLLAQYEELRTADVLREYTISIIEPALPPAGPSKPNKMLNMMLGGFVGLFGGVALAFLLHSLDTRFHTVEQIEATVESSVLGKIPTARHISKKAFLFTFYPYNEAFRRLRINLLSVNNGPLKTVLVTSAEPQEGKSTIAVNLTLSLAQTGLRVLLIDADMRRPRLHDMFDIANKIGLSDVLQEKSTLAESAQNSTAKGIKLLTSGPAAPDATALLEKNIQALLQDACSDYDIILLDTPAAQAVSDAAVLASFVDGVLVVVSHKHAHRHSVKSMCRQLNRVNARLIGVVINHTKPEPTYRYYQPV